jgi:steroid delta-isomerase-like uncharacterized protein
MAPIRELVEEASRVYATGDPDAAADLYADDAVLVVPGARYEGKQQIRHYWAQLMRGTPNGTAEIRRCLEDDNVFYGELVVRGTNTGELVLPTGTTVPATGKATEIPAMEVVRVRDGKVVEQHVYFDMLTLMVQLGLLPG